MDLNRQGGSLTAFDRLEALLRLRGVPFAVLRHEPVFTSEEAARVRGTPLASGAKALVMKAGERFVMLVFPADRKLDSKKVRNALRVRELRFASKEELLALTGLAPGSVPPFGSLFGLPTYVDPSLGENASINFNAGEHTVSVQMRYVDYVKAECPAEVSVT